MIIYIVIAKVIIVTATVTVIIYVPVTTIIITIIAREGRRAGARGLGVGGRWAFDEKWAGGQNIWILGGGTRK